MELFSEKGYHNVPMQENAQRPSSPSAPSTSSPGQGRPLQNTDQGQSRRIPRNSRRGPQTVRSEMWFAVLKSYVAAKAAVFTGGAAMLRLYFAETRGASFTSRLGWTSKSELVRRSPVQAGGDLPQGVYQKVFRRSTPITWPSHWKVYQRLPSVRLEDPERHPYEANVPLILAYSSRGCAEMRAAISLLLALVAGRRSPPSSTLPWSSASAWLWRETTTSVSPRGNRASRY